MTTDARIKDILASAAPVTHDEMEISGYKDALNLIHTTNEDLDLTDDIIRLFHRTMEESAKRIEAGRYKRTNNFIMEYGPDKGATGDGSFWHVLRQGHEPLLYALAFCPFFG